MSEADNWFDTWPDALIAIDERGLISAYSPQAEALLGWSRAEALGLSPHALLCALSRGFLHAEQDCPLTPTRAASQREYRTTCWRHKSGVNQSVDYRMLDFQYRGASALLTFIDNDNRRHSQAEMDKFAECVELSPAPIGEFDGAGQMLFGNGALQQYLLDFGFDDQGQANILPRDIASICARASDLYGGDADARHAVCEIAIDQRVFNWHFHPVVSAGETTVLAYAFDISAQKRAERIAEEQRNLARKEFYATMVHELRTPLNAIIGFSDMLLARLGQRLDERELKRLQMIKSAGVQLNELVTATLDVTKIDAGKMTLDISEFAIAELCQEVSQQMQPLADNKGLNLRTTLAVDYALCSDRVKVRQILANLVSNAIKYTPEGSVHIVVSEGADPTLGGVVSLLVADTGIGIPEEKLPLLFNSFEQVEDIRSRGIEGTGLGLALVNKLVRLLGGRVSVHSEYGVGSRFEVLLPHGTDFQ